MMMVRCLSLLGIAASFCFPAIAAQPAAESSLAPLLAYQGTWVVSRGNGAAPERLENLCARAGTFFVCQQKVNGAVAGLLVFIPDNRPGHYFTQTIRPQGWATGRDELEISGNRWVLTSSRQDRGVVTYYRTVTTFVNRGYIRFEQAQSKNRKDWVVTGSGEQKRVSDRK